MKYLRVLLVVKFLLLMTSLAQANSFVNFPPGGFTYSDPGSNNVNINWPGGFTHITFLNGTTAPDGSTTFTSGWVLANNIVENGQTFNISGTFGAVTADAAGYVSGLFTGTEDIFSPSSPPVSLNVTNTPFWIQLSGKIVLGQSGLTVTGGQIDPATTPEASTLLLFATGMCGIGGVLRYKSKTREG